MIQVRYFEVCAQYHWICFVLDFMSNGYTSTQRSLKGQLGSIFSKTKCNTFTLNPNSLDLNTKLNAQMNTWMHKCGGKQLLPWLPKAASRCHQTLLAAFNWKLRRSMAACVCYECLGSCIFPVNRHKKWCQYQTLYRILLPYCNVDAH